MTDYQTDEEVRAFFGTSLAEPLPDTEPLEIEEIEEMVEGLMASRRFFKHLRALLELEP